jgi:hypothetical protein
MTLGELIEALEEKYNQDPGYVAKLGFAYPHSYRGFYDALAFEPVENISLHEMLNEAQSAPGKTFVGYKGGDFLMDSYSDVYLAKHYHVGEEIGPTFLKFILHQI